MNILINFETGNITGIVDWAEARVLPFGFALWGLENMFGYMDSTGWHYYDNRHELEEHFWQAFWTKTHNTSEGDMQLIRSARMVGLFCRYGFTVEGKTLKGMIVPTDPSSLMYLDAFCTTVIYAPTTQTSSCHAGYRAWALMGIGKGAIGGDKAV